jgi:hypothetical protein
VASGPEGEPQSCTSRVLIIRFETQPRESRISTSMQPGCVERLANGLPLLATEVLPDDGMEDHDHRMPNPSSVRTPPTRGPGAGLGLALSKTYRRSARRHDPRQSTPALGSRFSVCPPVRCTPPRRPRPKPMPARAERTRKSRCEDHVGQPPHRGTALGSALPDDDLDLPPAPAARPHRSGPGAGVPLPPPDATGAGPRR